MKKHLLKAGIRAASVIHPSQTARWIEQMLLTPSRYPRSSTTRFERPNASSARSFELPDGRCLNYWDHGEGPTVVAVHGWGSSAATFHHFVEPIVERGFRLVRYDAPAHEPGSSEMTNAVECAHALNAIAAQLSPVYAVMAHSFGAPTTAYALKLGLEVDRLVLLAPPRDLFGLTTDMVARMGTTSRVRRIIESAIVERVGVQGKDVLTDSNLSGFDGPALVVHDSHDGDVPWEDGLAVARALRRGRLRTTRGLGHRWLLRDTDVINHVAGFIAEE